jgi:hypothetical protein
VNKNRIYTMPSIRPVTFLASLALVATLRAATPMPAENSVAAPASVGSPHSLKDTVPIESLGDSILAPRKGFEVVPGKDPNGWSFVLEPYLWALGVDGTVGSSLWRIRRRHGGKEAVFELSQAVAQDVCGEASSKLGHCLEVGFEPTLPLRALR